MRSARSTVSQFLMAHSFSFCVSLSLLGSVCFKSIIKSRRSNEDFAFSLKCCKQCCRFERFMELHKSENVIRIYRRWIDFIFCKQKATNFSCRSPIRLCLTNAVNVCVCVTHSIDFILLRWKTRIGCAFFASEHDLSNEK